MPELPSREDVSASEDAPWRAYIPTYASWVLNDYADGVLSTRQEFIDSLDIEAAVKAYGHFGLNGDGTPVTPDDIANMEHIIAAALGEGTT